MQKITGNLIINLLWGLVTAFVNFLITHIIIVAVTLQQLTNISYRNLNTVSRKE